MTNGTRTRKFKSLVLKNGINRKSSFSSCTVCISSTERLERRLNAESMTGETRRKPNKHPETPTLLILFSPLSPFFNRLFSLDYYSQLCDEAHCSNLTSRLRIFFISILCRIGPSPYEMNVLIELVD